MAVSLRSILTSLGAIILPFLHVCQTVPGFCWRHSGVPGRRVPGQPTAVNHNETGTVLHVGLRFAGKEIAIRNLASRVPTAHFPGGPRLSQMRRRLSLRETDPGRTVPVVARARSSTRSLE